MGDHLIQCFVPTIFLLKTSNRMFEKHPPPPPRPVESPLQLPRVPGNSSKTTGHSRWPLSSFGGGGHGVHLLPGTVLSLLYQGMRGQCPARATSFLCQVNTPVPPWGPQLRPPTCLVDTQWFLVLRSNLWGEGGGARRCIHPPFTVQWRLCSPNLLCLPNPKETCQLGSKARVTPDQGGGWMEAERVAALGVPVEAFGAPPLSIWRAGAVRSKVPTACHPGSPLS